MGPLGLVARIEAMLRRDRRRRFIAAGPSLVTIAGIALAVYFAAFAGGWGFFAGLFRGPKGAKA